VDIEVSVVWRDLVQQQGYGSDFAWWYSSLRYGAIIAVADLVGCCPITMRNGVGLLCPPGHARQDVSAQETALGDYTPGRYGWVLDNARALATPIPYKGRQGLFSVPGELLAGLL
jgi:hypothetical protein